MNKGRILVEQNDGNEVAYNSHKDRWSRKAKHQIPLSEKSDVKERYYKGDVAIYENSAVEVIIDTDKNYLTGIKVDGKLKMVPDNKLVRLEENVLGGLQSVTPLNRIMQLAGLSTPVVMGDDANSEQLDEAQDPTNMFEGLYKANLAGEFKNNPDAARIATVGQIMVGLNSVIEPLRDKVDPAVMSKLNVAVGLGAALIKQSREMLKA